MSNLTYITLCLSMLLISCNEDKPVEKKATPAYPSFTHTKYATIELTNPYQKVIYVRNQLVHMHVVAKSDSMEYFDFNVIDKESYKNYQPGGELKYIYKMAHRKSIDTIIILDKGSYLFAFENIKNSKPINVSIKLKTIE